MDIGEVGGSPLHDVLDVLLLPRLILIVALLLNCPFTDLERIVIFQLKRFKA